MEVRTLETLKDRYPTSSWALWSADFPESGSLEEDPDDLYEFIKSKRDQLRPSIILLSLNPSTHLPTNYQNFHSMDPKHRNGQFRDIVENANLEGAYMTDLVERTVQHDSNKVEPTRDDVYNLLDQLDHLDQDRYYIISFLEKVFTTLKEFFDSRARKLPHDIKGFTTTQNGRQLECYRVWFHANWGANQDKIPALHEQLSFFNSEIINNERSDLSRWIE